MKRIILPFLIIFVCSFGTAAFEVEHRIAQRPDSLLVSDSLDLFRDITDISRQIERRTTQSSQEPSDILQPSGNITDSVIIPPVHRIRETVSVDTIRWFRNRLDSIYFRKENGTLFIPMDNNSFESMHGLSFKDTLFYNPLFLPMIFTGEILPRELSFYTLDKDKESGKLVPRDKTFAPKLDHIDFVRSVRRDYYLKYPDRIRYSVASFDTIARLKTDDHVVKETFNPLKELLKAETTYSLETPGVEGATIGRRYWVRSGEHTFQFIQNRFSDNWHKGGTNNLNFQTYHIFRANYKKNKVKFNNMLEWRLSLFNAPDDTIRKYRIGNDFLRYYGDFGIDAFAKGWTYSTNLEGRSQMLNAYPANSKDIRSSFLSPLYAKLGVGLKYTLNKPSTKVRGRNLNLQLFLDPISLNYTYVWNDSVDVKRYGIPEDKKGLLDIGSNVRAIMKYKITNYIVWDSDLTYFTSFEKVVVGFENKLDLALSNAFSTNIYVNMRFDDGVPPDPKLKYFQITHTLTFGLSYKW